MRDFTEDKEDVSEAGFFGRVAERARREVQRDRAAAADSGTSESSFLMTAPPELRKL